MLLTIILGFVFGWSHSNSQVLLLLHLLYLGFTLLERFPFVTFMLSGHSVIASIDRNKNKTTALLIL